MNVADAQWILIIDTEQYAGNFERSLAAWVTGVTDPIYSSHRAVKESADNFFESTGRTKCIECYVSRPLLVPTPGWHTDDNGKHFRDGEKKGTTRCEGPAYLSLALPFFRKPTANELLVMINRVMAYKNWIRKMGRIRPINLTITNVRLIKQEISKTTVACFRYNEKANLSEEDALALLNS